MTRKSYLYAFIFTICLCLTLHADKPPKARWWKGNTHTHTWWSDGDSPPETVTAWYKENGYNFLFLSDHNILSQGEKWYPLKRDVQKKAFEMYKKKFGADWAQTRQGSGTIEVKLTPMNEFRSLFDVKNKFIVIMAEEISDQYDKKPIHLNALNLVSLIMPRGGNSVVETMQRNIDAVIQQSRETGQRMLVHVNHPNFGWAIQASELAQIQHQNYFEIYNGHSGVRNYGDETHISTERMWDEILTERLTTLDLGNMYGIADDDAHEYVNWGVGRVNPGRGWVMVRARRLTPQSILKSMHGGDYYCSTGVTLKDVQRKNETLSLQVKAEPYVDYTIQLIGTKKDAKKIGQVFNEVRGTSASYTLQDDDLYIRAKVVSSKMHPNPFAKGDVEVAWTQPVIHAQK